MTGHRRRRSKPSLTVDRVLKLAEAHRVRTGRWPTERSGRVHDAPGVTWHRINLALWQGRTDAPEGTQLRDMLREHFGVMTPRASRPLSEQSILSWADKQHKRTGQWPNITSGRVFDAPGESWRPIDNAMRKGFRGLAGGTSLAQLLTEQRGVASRAARPGLSESQILRWADDHYASTGRWPNLLSGAVARHRGSYPESWKNIDQSLMRGDRGLPGGDTLSRLLARERGARVKAMSVDLSVERILEWADAHHGQTGQWPNSYGGAVLGHEDETWPAINSALYGGWRGLPGGTSLAQLLAERRGVKTPLTERQILEWADDHHARIGAWPSSESGAVLAADDEQWKAIAEALRVGFRGLPGGQSLAKLLASTGRCKRLAVSGPKIRELRDRRALSVEQVSTSVGWADRAACGFFRDGAEETDEGRRHRPIGRGPGLPTPGPADRAVTVARMSRPPPGRAEVRGPGVCVKTQ
ncbi:MAG: hypothetical protein GC159_17555 [Phycisphaera sp.]|nr:hypothetical protein [Phycisphaera sp.]